MFSNNPEVELLLSCARTHLDPATTERIHSLARKEIDWEYLVQMSIRHGVLPLLYQSLKKTCPEAVPDDTLEQLRTYFLANATRNLFLTGKLLKLLGLLKNNGILAIPFKGPVLAESVYEDLSLRQFTDLDILVYEHDALKARNILMSHGYEPAIRLDDAQFKVYVKTEDSISTISDSKVIVDLHWEMSGRYSSFSFGLDSFRNRLEPATLAGKRVLHLLPEELLLYLCVHGTKDCWENLELVSCVAELVRSRPDMDWIQVTHLARKMHCERILFLGLSLASDLLGATIPGEVHKCIERDHKIREIATEVHKDLFHDGSYPSGNLISSRFSLFHLKIRDNNLDRIRYGLHLAISPTMEDWRLFPLPVILSFLHYLLRPIRLAVGLVSALRNMHRYNKSKRTL